MNAVALIARREVDQRLRSKSFAISTAAFLIGILAIGVISRFAADDGEDPLVVATAGAVPAGFGEALEQAAAPFEREVSVFEAPDADAATASLEQGGDDRADAALIADDGRLVFRDSVDATEEAIVQQAWASANIRQSLDAAGLSPEQAAEVLSPPPLTTGTLEEDDGELTGLAVLTGTVTAVLLFFSLQTFGQYVLVGVVEEKSSAVVELLLARVRASQLLAGKVLGIGVVALLQFALMVIAGVVSMAISGASIPGEIWRMVPTTLLWFLLGYAFYSTLFGLAGSLVSRQEDAQGAAVPIMTMLVGAYMVVFVFGYDPDSTVSTVLSLIPPITPFLMPMRMAAGAASLVEIVVAAVLLALATVAVTKLAGRIYEQVLLRRGARIPWRDALATLRGR